MKLKTWLKKETINCIIIYCLINILAPFSMNGQEEDYNVRGDFFYNSGEFNTAVFHYSQGASESNIYAFKKIAKIFLELYNPFNNFIDPDDKNILFIPIYTLEYDYLPSHYILMFKSVEGNELADFFLGYCYDVGFGVEKNWSEAKLFYTKVKNNPFSMRRIAVLLI